MDAVEQALSDFYHFFDKQTANLWVAYSGGMDSHVLLHALVATKHICPNLSIRVIHINHQLQDDSTQWARHCQRVCDNLTVPLTIIPVDVDTATGLSPEEAAREARYQAISNILASDDYLLTAHHQNDQAETLLLQLMRGAGLSGLSAMSQFRDKVSFKHARPLLDLPRVTLEEYATKHGLNWIEDPTNQDIDVRRNFVRHKIIPALLECWPKTNQLIASSAGHLDNYKELVDWYLNRDLASILAADDVLDIEQLKRFPRLVQAHLIRQWYLSLGLAKPGPGKLAIIFDEVINAKQDAKPVLQWQSSQLVRAKNKLLLLPLWPKTKENSWLDETEIDTTQWCFNLSISDSIDRTKIRIEQGNYQLCININQVNKRLKDIYKDKCIPALLRPLVPVVYYQDEVVMIPHIYVEKEFETADFSFDFKRFTIRTNDQQLPLISVLSNG